MRPITLSCLFLYFFLWGGGLLSAQSLPPNIFPDTSHAPFLYGVASGDPVPYGVMLWTHLTPDSLNAPADSVYWEVAPTSNFLSILDSGYAVTDSSVNWTVKVDVQNLPVAGEIFYRFRSSSGNWSMAGRSRTVAPGTSSQLKFGLASCSSVYSGWFNAYARLAGRTDLDALIHVGDYIYDFVDQDEEIRVPTPYPTVPVSLDEWRDRHRYYCMDADLRALRAQVPLVMMWDNHDLDGPAGRQAFHEWNPTRLPDPNQPERFYRKLSFGSLADVFMIDVNTWRGQDSLPDGTPSTLGLAQQAWLLSELAASTATWKLVGTPKMFSRWGTTALQQFFPTPGGVFDLKAWDGYTGERRLILQLIDSLDIHNVIMLSGDTHCASASDLKYEPADSMPYDPATGQGGLGMEFAAASVARGNFDESGIPDWLIDLLIPASINENPHQQFLDLKQHGYGILNLEAQEATGEFWFTEILQPDTAQTLGALLRAKINEDHWERTSTGRIGPASAGPFQLGPNPFDREIYVLGEWPERGEVSLSLFALNGEEVARLERARLPAGSSRFNWNLPELPSGPYILQIQSRDLVMRRLLIHR